MFLLGDGGLIDPEAVREGVAFTPVTSASDLKAVSECEWAFLRRLDGKLGRAPVVDEPEDAMNRRAAGLGDEHEGRWLEKYRGEFGDGVVEIPRPSPYTAAGLRDAATATVEAFDGADVVFQATFFDEAWGAESGHGSPVAFVGFADFIVRRPDGRYRVQDTKLSRTARVVHLLQLAAYAEQLERLGVPVDTTVELLLGSGSTSGHALAEIAPVFGNRRARLKTLVAEHLAQAEPVAWGDERYVACGRCAHCEPAVVAHRDVLLTAGLSVRQRQRLRRAGLTTIDELAAASGSVDGVADTTLAALREQALVQLESGPGAPAYRLRDAGALAAIPEPDDGDIFFDFEGDPLYTEGVPVPGRPTTWGLDYLFGLVCSHENYTAFWAHDFAQERQALLDFLDFVAARRAEHPELHIYHYAPYERTHLASLAARHGVGEAEVDELLRAGVLVDLYPIVRRAVRVGSRSYSIKKLEPLYMGDRLRDSEGVTTAVGSVQEYAEACARREAGDEAEAERVLASIADYNEYDCVSTLKLRDWLLARAREAGVEPGTGDAGDVDRSGGDDIVPSSKTLVRELEAYAGDGRQHERTDDQQALALAAAAIEYHAREQKTFWWEHFARLEGELGDWGDTRDVFVVDRAVVEADWERRPREHGPKRTLRLTGRFAPGSRPVEGSTPFTVYDDRHAFQRGGSRPGQRPWSTATIVQVDEAAGAVTVRETLPRETHPYDAMPMALTPPPPPSAAPQPEAIAEWGEKVVAEQPQWPLQPAVDILRRIPSRLHGVRLERLVESADPENRADAIAEAVRALDGSYLAVQGPPGTGKTYLGARVIATLVREHGWKVGVVGQSHKVVENLLDAVVDAGLPAGVVGKVPKRGEQVASHRFTRLDRTGREPAFAAEQSGGWVIGGTAWTFANGTNVPRESLDLLVVDEAGQFSLASTVAASVATRNMLLLGDPQQLPQVSQAVHAEPIDESALGWVSAGHDVLPADRGFFLAESRRMHPAVTEAVSRLSYEGRLNSHPSAGERFLEGVEAGLHAVPVVHAGDSVESTAEADAVVRIVSDTLNRAWSDPHAASPREREPLTEADIIVVTPYNAQLTCVRERLDGAGYGEVQVGTVDKFQGQEAVVSIVTLAASSAEDVPRGMEFLLMKNRLNVAISRAQWAAYLVYSPGLADHLPAQPEGVARLSAFLDLVEGSASSREPPYSGAGGTADRRGQNQ